MALPLDPDDEVLGAASVRLEPRETSCWYVDVRPESHTRQEINWFYGPINFSGYLYPHTFEAEIFVSINGVKVGPVSGYIHHGFEVDFRLLKAMGKVRIFLKHGNEFWIGLDMEVTPQGHFKGDYLIMRF
ncbi:hypothetical protein PEBR_23399 [Penicillium brasilianum]|uniref:Uncharacterized protein n=1 Tax=Penicillium brasilianum TaxID=104259 RepID=A0A1S9RKE8_PENBI|nr:hypothetical protein PEBR_23399 [Penicillium brasilianum]